MPGLTLTLHDFPEFRAALEQIAALQQEVTHLRARQLKWVNDEQAQQITGLSRRSLLRERQRPGTLIVHKEDHGVRYDYDSLLAHNNSRALGRGGFAALLT